MILVAPNGATMDVCDEAVDRLLAAGFRKVTEDAVPKDQASKKASIVKESVEEQPAKTLKPATSRRRRSDKKE